MKFTPSPSTSARIAGAVLLAAAAVLPARADYQSTVLSQGPVGYWRLNETTQPLSYTLYATNIGSLGSPANGNYNNFPSRALPGPFAGSTAVGLDGVSQSVATPWEGALNTSSFSVEVWVNPTHVPQFGYIATSVHTASPRSGWYLVQDNNGTFGLGNGFVVRMFYQNGATPGITLFATNDLPLGSWYHLVLTFDGTTATLYKNGAVAQSGTPAGFVPNVDAQFSVGMRSDNGFFWGGQAAEVAMYNTALSSSRVSTHYTVANSTPANYAPTVQADAPTLYWRFQEPPDPSAANIGSLSSINGRYVYPARPGVVGPRSTANYAGFDTANTGVGVGTGGTVTVPAMHLNTNTVTITGWLNLTNPQPQSAGVVFCRGGTTVAGLTMDPVGYGGGYGLGYNWGGAGVSWSPFQDSGLPALPDSAWAFVALVITPTNATIYDCDQTNFANFLGVSFPATHGNENFDAATDFGLDANTTPVGINGAMDEVAIFNRSLSGGEVYTEYAAAVGGVPPRVFVDPQTPANPLYTGDTLTLTVDAGGTPNLSYQWRQNSSPLAGATTSVYTKSGVTAADNGNYDCVVSNPYGNPTSAAASIIVNPAFPPSITTGPVARNLYPGGTLNLSVVATGGGLHYQWSKGATPIGGATASTYSIARVAVADAATYTVTVTNGVGSANASAAITVSNPQAGSFAAAIVTDSPEAWFRLDETSGTTMWDSMGRHDGYYTNVSGSPVTLGVAGAITGSSDTAVSFDGTSTSYGYVPFASTLNRASFTIECWAKTSDTTDGGPTPVSSRSGIPAGYWLWTYPAGQWSGGVSSGGNNYYVPTTVASDFVVPGQWKHVVMSFDSTTALRVYVDGQWDGAAYVDFARNTTAPLIIGALGPEPVGNLFNGQVDEVLVYTNALTLAQAQNHYNLARFGTPTPPFFLLLPGSEQVISNSAATFTLTGAADGFQPLAYQWYKNGTAISGATTTTLTLSCAYSNAASYVLRATNSVGVTNSPAVAVTMIPANPAFANVTNSLVLHLKFDGNYNDSSGRGNNGTAHGANLQFVPGRLGSSALFFYTSNSLADVNYVTLGTPADLNFGASQNFSVSYWVKTFAGQTNGDLPFLCTAITSTFAPGYTFAPSYKQGGWAWSLNGVGVYGAPASIIDGNWHHVLSTFDRAGLGTTYLDGVQVDSRNITGAGNLDTGNVVTIGQDPTGAYTEDGSATIDDLAVWRRALTATEAYSIYYVATNSNSSFDVPGNVSLNIGKSGSNVTITWRPGATLGTLLSAPSLSGPWTPVNGVYTPSYTFTPTGGATYFRLQTIE